MSATIKGKVTHVLPKETVGQNSKEKQTFVIKTEDQYPKDVAFEAWDKAVGFSSKLKQGDTVEVSYDVQSREYNGRWFTTAKAFKIVTVSSGAGSSAAVSGGTDDGLPF